MKTPCTILATALAAVLRAAVPIAWTNAPGMPPYPLKPVPHGVPVDFRVTLKGYTEPPVADGADVRLWYQTNGMGAAWWSAPATLDGDVITATFGPAQDTGADRVNLFFGAPSNVFAAAVLRLTHSPGFAPASLPLPVPVLDFSAVEVRGLAALTNGWTFGDAGGPYLSATGGTIIAQLATPDAGLEVRMPGIPMLGSPPRATRMRADGFGVSNLAGDWLWLDSLGFRFVSGGDDVRFNLPLGTTGGTLARLEDVDLTDATNYTDAVAHEFMIGDRMAGYAEYAAASSAIDGEEGQMYQSDLLGAMTNAAEAVTAKATNELDRAIRADFPSGTPDWRVEYGTVYDVHFVTNGALFADAAGYDSIGVNLNGWPEYAAMFVKVSGLDYPYTVPGNVRLVGYGTWPTTNQSNDVTFQSVWWRSGTNIFVNILVEE